MNHTNTWIRAAFTFLLLSSDVSMAQNQLLVTLTDGTIDTYDISEIRSIKFSGNTMNLLENNGSQTAWKISEIVDYKFSYLTSTNLNSSFNNEQVHIFPNPIFDHALIEYYSTLENDITIELLDLNGKILRTVFRGPHKGKQAFQWSNDLPGGFYLCRIQTRSKSITKPIIIQQ
jgi:hypothetical protein